MKIVLIWTTSIFVGFCVFQNSAWAVKKANAVKAVSKLEISDTTTLREIRDLPDTATVVTRKGKTISAKQYKALADAVMRIKKSKRKSLSVDNAGFSRSQGATTVKLTKGVNLQEIAKRSDKDVLELPDGKKITVGDLRKLSEVRKKLKGQSLLAMTPTKRPSREGKASKIYTRDDLKKYASAPDSTILETANGKRMTVGELRAFQKSTGTDLGVGK